MFWKLFLAQAVPLLALVTLLLADGNGELAGLSGLTWVGAGVTALGMLGLALLLARRITRPLRELTRRAEHIAAGDYESKVYEGGAAEIAALARTFNRMTDRLAAQFAQLDEDRQQLRAILSGMVEGVIALDAEQRILFVNDRAAHLLELQATPVIGRKLWEMFRQRALQQLVRRALSRGEACREELTLTNPSVTNLTVHAAPFQGGPARGAVLVLHDTTELRRLERLRHEFVANVSHELKTPLSVIQACVETLLDGAVEDRAHRGPFLEQIADQSSRLHSLILDLLSLARIESGTEAFVFQPVSLAEVVRACLKRHRARAESQNQSLQAMPPRWQADRATEAGEDQTADEPPVPDSLTAVSPNHDVLAWADEEAVGQIVENLVDNALKYTPPGGRIGVRWRAEGKHVILEVEDTGIGIPERDLPRIFERFYRVDKARSRALGGTGLGLSIVKHLAQAMHGSVRATSQVGQGSTFHVRLPRADHA
ncbi:MAG: cell wall metabolism sensor histidine kinase WalK [Gemmataceae bacterium]|nr:cell wall metabolism sensor histidine kinase WalK [Gemmataceae bacterium]